MVTIAERIGKNAVHNGFSSVANTSAEGLRELLSETETTWEGNRLRNDAYESLVELACVTAACTEFSVNWQAHFNLAHSIKLLLRRRADRKNISRVVGRYFREGSVEIFEQLVARYANEFDDGETRWRQPYEQNQRVISDAAMHLREHWESRVEFTNSMIQYRVSEDAYPINRGNFADGWRNHAELAYQGSHPELATLFCVSLVQIAWATGELEGGEIGYFDDELARLAVDCDRQPVDEAFEMLKRDNKPFNYHETVPHHSHEGGNGSGVIGRILREKVGNQDKFSTWLETFEDNVESRIDSNR